MKNQLFSLSSITPLFRLFPAVTRIRSCLFSIALLCCLTLNVQSQSGNNSCWERQVSSANLFLYLNNLFFTDTMTGWATDGQIIYHTTDGGILWQQQQQPGISNTINDLHFTDNNTGWAVGYSGTILHTSNGGTNWQQQSSGTSETLTALHFIDNNTGWTVGYSGAIHHTTNGGSTWLPQSSGTQNDLFEVYFIDELLGWAVGDSGVILHTSNGGADWQQQSSGTSSRLNSLYFIDNDTGWIVGNAGTILHTLDGGSAWEAQSSGISAALSGVHFADGQLGWAAVSDSIIIRTMNGGMSWQPQEFVGLRYVSDIYFIDSQIGWVSGRSNFDATALYRTSDGGLTWNVQATNFLNDVHFVDSQTGWAVGYNNILHTSNGGASWQGQIAPGISNSTVLLLYGVHFTDDQTGWVVGGAGKILHTSNAGVTWEPQSTGINEALWDIYFTDTHEGWAVGGNGKVLHTENGGANWQQQTSGTSELLFRMHFTDSQTGWAVGGAGTIIHTTNGGNTWQQQLSGTSNTLRDVHFVDSLTGWVVGYNNTVLHTTDGGINWQQQPPGIVSDIVSVYFIDNQSGWIITSSGILHTSNGGNNWFMQFIPEYPDSEYFIDFYIIDNQNGWVVGGNGSAGGLITKITPGCASYTNTLSASLFHDTANCLPDSTDQPLAQWLVKAEGANQTFYAVTDTAGRFAMLVDTGAYALTAQLPNALWAPCDTIQVQFDQPGQTLDTTIGVQTAYDCPLLNVDIATPFLRRCSTNYYYVNWRNEGPAPAENARVDLHFDPLLQVDTSSLPDPWTDLGGNRFRIELGDVAPGAGGSFAVQATVPCDAVLGTPVCVKAYIFPDSICFPTPGWDGSNLEITAVCQGNTVHFTITNTGTGAMLYTAEYIIIENVVLHPGGDLQLPKGADTLIIVSDALNQTWSLMANQHPAHPFSPVASATVRGCSGAGNFQFFLQLPQEDASPFVSADCHPVIGSWDPNDKQVLPQGLDSLHTIRDDTPLEYLIRFQNTGTDTAFRVVVRDTLSPALDPASVHPGASSHPYRFDIAPGNVLTFYFENILLPDSNVNEAASHGFVQFSVRQKTTPLNPPGTRIENKAAIYFDFNAPVWTETVFHTVTGPVVSVFRDTVCQPDGPPALRIDTLQYSSFQVIHETLETGTLYGTADTAVCPGDTILNIVVLGPVQIVETLVSVAGCDSVLTINVDTLPVSKCLVPTMTPDQALPVQLFPNPARGYLNLRLLPAMHEQVTAVEIHDATGRLRQLALPPPDGAGGTVLKIPVSELPVGVYFLTVRGAKTSRTVRFVKLN